MTGGFGPGNIGSGQQQPMQREIETSAWAEAAKILAGMIHPDEIKPFVEVQSHNTWKYSTDSSKPELDHKLSSLRMGLESLEAKAEEWESKYNDMLAFLKKEIRERLQREMELPLLQRDISYVVLNRVLVFFAVTSTWLSRITAPKDPNSPAVRAGEVNKELPILALFGLIAQAGEIQKEALELLFTIGPNHAEHDAIMNMLRDYNLLQEEMRELAKELAKKEDPQSFQTQFRSLSNRIHAMVKRATHATYADQLQILIPSLKAMETAVAALSLRNASPSLLISFTPALTSLYKSDGEGGLIGPHLQNVMEGVISGVLSLADFGTGGEIADLKDLGNDLKEFADVETGGER